MGDKEVLNFFDFFILSHYIDYTYTKNKADPIYIFEILMSCLPKELIAPNNERYLVSIDRHSDSMTGLAIHIAKPGKCDIYIYPKKRLGLALKDGSKLYVDMVIMECHMPDRPVFCSPDIKDVLLYLFPEQQMTDYLNNLQLPTVFTYTIDDIARSIIDRLRDCPLKEFAKAALFARLFSNTGYKEV